MTATTPTMPDDNFTNITMHAEPVHNKQKALGLWNKSITSLELPINQLCDYYGEHVTMYFAWMQFFSSWLVLPAIVGIILWFSRPANVTVEDSPLIPFFSLFVVVWGVCFLKFWNRQCASISYDWKTLEMDAMEQPNPHFKGIDRINPHTGKSEKYYPFQLQIFYYFVSAVVTSIMLVIAFTVMVCSLNLQGYVHVDSLFRVENLFEWAKPGAPFDPDGPIYMSLIPVVCHSIIILIMNSVYSSVAEKLTVWENHKTELGHENAVIMKRFFFEAFDAYIPLFYLAFYEKNVLALRLELVSLFATDTIRRVVVESIIPFAMEILSGFFSSRKQLVAWVKDDNRDEYEQFDDYLEMVIEFGYIILFASAFPLAAGLSILCNIVEVRSDLFKLTFVTKRPHKRRVNSIGIWQGILNAIVGMSIVTNCFIFAFSSNQMAEWFPSLFNDGGSGRDTMKRGAGRIVVGMAWGLEHVIILIAVVVWNVIDNRPERVRDLLADKKRKNE